MYHVNEDMEYIIRSGPVRWQTSKSFSVVFSFLRYLSHFLRHSQIVYLENVGHGHGKTTFTIVPFSGKYQKRQK